MKAAFKGIFIGLFAILMVFLASSVGNLFVRDEPDLVRLTLRAPLTTSEVASQLPGSSVADEEEHIVRVPYGRTDEYGKLAMAFSNVRRVAPVPLEHPTISFRHYLFSLQDRLKGYSRGDLGLIRTSNGSYDLPVNGLLKEAIGRTFAYLIPGLVVGVLAAVALSLFASWSGKSGKLLDGAYAILSGLPDFLLVVLIQLAAIYLSRIAGTRVILVAQFGEEVPFLIPFAAIAMIPCLLVYGTLRMAIRRELALDYVTTAFAKGLTKREVLLRHVLRNVLEDLLTVLPKATTLAIASMAVAEAMCDIFGLGGIIVSPRLQNVSATPTLCIVLAVVAIAFQALYGLIRRRFVVNAKEEVSST